MAIRINNKYQKEFVRLLNEISYRHNKWQVFRDFCELVACSMASSFYTDQVRKNILDIHDRYSREEIEKMELMMNQVISGLEESYHDFLGDVFSVLELYNKYRGQFFTPYHICKFKAQIVINKEDLEKHQQSSKGYFTISDPCVGAGALLIAVADHIRELGFNHSEVVFFHAQDVDQLAFYMSYIQLSLSGMAGVCICGNSLLPDNEENTHWYTPVYFVSKTWQTRRAIESLSMIMKPVEKEEKIEDLPEVEKPDIKVVKDQLIINW